MGLVYEAVQSSLGRLVAVKRLRRDLMVGVSPEGSKLNDLLFRHEAVTAARLEHPNIIPVHDLGRDTDGSPLLAMKLIDGRTWDAVLEEDFTELPEWEYYAKHLPILVDVAQAVAFAHDRGIVHRDLKPSQVILGSYGEVLLTDWGLSIYYDDDLRRQWPVDYGDLPDRRTASNPAGTPALMAPEQTHATAQGIGPWTDIFLLGGILYIILTGKFPFEAGNSVAAVKLAKRCRFPRPTARCADRVIPSELETLCLRCMAADPAARPASAKEVVAALGSFLSGASHRRQSTEMVRSVGTDFERLDSLGETYEALNEFLNRLSQAQALWGDNPLVADLKDRVLGRLVARALEFRDLRLALLSAGRLRPGPDRAEWSRRIEAEERQIAQQAVQRRVLRALVVILAVGMLGGFAYYTNRVGRERDEARLQRESALRQSELALQARESSEQLVAFMLGDMRQRVANVDPTLQVLTTVASEAFDYYRRQPFSELPEDQRLKNVRGLILLGDLTGTQGNTALSLETYSEALMRIRLARREAADPWPWKDLEATASFYSGSRLFRLGRTEEGLAGYRANYDIRTDFARQFPRDMRHQRNLLDSAKGLANALYAADRPAEALPLFQEAIAIGENLVAREPENLVWRRDLGRSLGDLAQYHLFAGERESGRKLLARAQAIWMELVSLREVGDDFRSDYAHSLAFSAQIALSEGRVADAITEMAAAAEQLEQVVAGDATDVQAKSALATALVSLGSLQREAGDLVGAESALDRGAVLVRALAKANPDDRGNLEALAMSLTQLAELHMATGQFDQARERLEDARDAASLLFQRPGRFSLAMTGPAFRQALLEQRIGRLSEAAAAYADATTMFERFPTKPASVERRERALIEALQALCHLAMGNREGWQQQLVLAEAELRRLHEADTASVRHRLDLAMVIHRHAESLLDNGNAVAAKARAQEASNLLHDVAGGSTEARLEALRSLLVQARAEVCAGDLDAALASAEAALAAGPAQGEATSVDWAVARAEAEVFLERVRASHDGGSSTAFERIRSVREQLASRLGEDPLHAAGRLVMAECWLLEGEWGLGESRERCGERAMALIGTLESISGMLVVRLVRARAEHLLGLAGDPGHCGS